MLPKDARQIEEHDVFVCLYAEGFFEDPKFLEGLAYAVRLGKPVYCLKQEGFNPWID